MDDVNTWIGVCFTWNIPFLLLWRRYSRVLKQRNAALKQTNSMVVESLDTQFIQLGEQLHLARERHAALLNVMLQNQLSFFCDTLDEITMSYRKGWGGDSLAEALEASYSRDIERGSTSPGPHKADLYLTLNGIPAKERSFTRRAKGNDRSVDHGASSNDLRLRRNSHIDVG